MTAQLCIVSSTLQLLNVVEYLGTRGSDGDADLIVAANSPSLCERLCQEAKTDFGAYFQGVRALPKPVHSFSTRPRALLRSIHERRAVIDHLIADRSPRSLVFGHSGDALLLMAHTARHTGLTPVIVDDGLHTLSFLTDRVVFEHYSTFGSKPMTKAWLYGLAWGSNGSFQRSASFFTVFHRAASDFVDVVEENSYAFLRSTHSAGQACPSDPPHFLGQPLLEYGILTVPQMRKVLARTVDILGKPFIYFPHPRETDASLDVVREFAIGIERPVRGYEGHFLRLATKPPAIVSFFSSALAVLDRLAPEETNILALDVTPWMSHSISRIEMYFNFLSESPRTRVLRGAELGLLAHSAER